MNAAKVQAIMMNSRLCDDRVQRGPYTKLEEKRPQAVYLLELHHWEKHCHGIADNIGNASTGCKQEGHKADNAKETRKSIT